MNNKAFQHWPDSYRALAKCMYALREALPTLPLLASCCVHPRHWIPSEHVDFLRRMGGESTIAQPSFPFLYVKGLICLVSALYDTLCIVALKLRFAHDLPTQQVDVILKTWTTAPTHLAQPADFYYGNLRSQLSTEGKSSLYLAGDGRADEMTWVSKLKRPFAEWPLWVSMMAEPTRGYIPENLLIPVYAPVLTAIRQWITSFRLRRFARGCQDPALASLALYASFDSLRPFTTKNVMQYYIARAAVRRFSPSAYVTLYEGRPWEKLAWLGVKQESARCQIVGYQHTIILNHSISLLEPASRSWYVAAPDCVLCTGESTRHLLQTRHEALGCRLVVFGSHRRPPVATTAITAQPQGRTVIVLPEGIPSECTVLFNRALELAGRLPDHRFIFRCHPVLPFSKVESSLSLRAQNYPNVEISRSPSIQDDFARSSVILYRGSSSVLYAVLQGLKPFYLHDDSLPDVDPLFELKVWRESFTQTEEFLAGLLQFAKRNSSDHQAELDEAVAYVNAYTVPTSPEGVRNWLTTTFSKSSARTMEQVA